MAKDNSPSADIVLYRTEDRQTRLEVRLTEGTVWLTQAQMAELFQTTPQNITTHLRTIYADGELAEEATYKNYLQVRQEGARAVRRPLKHYNLDAILAVGFRVRSPRGTQFRQWASERLKEYVVKGFVLDDERLKEAGGGGYFDELLERIREIRASEKLFYRKVLEIYATSTDYDPRGPVSQQSFATVQNKMHWAAHGQTAAEVIVARVDADKPNMGLTHWKGPHPRLSDVAVAKNYLKHEELSALNLIVTAYLDFAELQALSRRPMTMRDWIAKRDDFLKLSERDILTHAGRISREQAIAKAEVEYGKYRTLTLGEPSAVERDFEETMVELKQLEDSAKRAANRRRKRPPAP